MHVVHEHVGGKHAIIMHEELDAHDLPHKPFHVHCLLDPPIVVGTLVKDRLQDLPSAIGDICILPVRNDVIGGARIVRETQRDTRTERNKYICLDERRVALGAFASWQATHVTRIEAEGGIGTGNCHERSGVGADHKPGLEGAGLKSAVND